MKARNQPCLEESALEWDGQHNPQSTNYGDIYYSREGGLAETRYVFLEQNMLSERWRTPGNQDAFVIAETGFGTGLNFLCAWHLWRTLPQTQNRVLHFVSFEKHPLAKTDLLRALSRWQNELSTEIEELINQYPFPVKGVHRLNFGDNRVKLTLIYEDAIEGLRNNHFLADAWFLDGFAPDKNPDMWQEGLLEEVARHSQKGASLSTFTCVGKVRRGLISNGFKVEKVKGYGRKREMLRASFEPESQRASYPHYLTKANPWGQFDSPPPSASQGKKSQVVVIGGGLSGTWTAWSLATRGIQVTLIEKLPRCGEAASGNPQGILYCKPGRQFTLDTQLGLHGCLYSYRTLSQQAQFFGRKDLWSPCGTVLLAYNSKTAEDQKILTEQLNYPKEMLRFVSPEEISGEVGTAVNKKGLLFTPSGWANPGEVCRLISLHPNIRIIDSACVEELEWRSQEQSWLIKGIRITATENEVPRSFSMTSSTVVVASAADASMLTQTQMLPIQSIRGQITQIPVDNDVARQLRRVVCGEGYVCPPKDNLLCFGATFNLKESNPMVTVEDHQKNLKSLAALTPELANRLQVQPHTPIHGRVGFRCTIPDYMPIVGPIPDVAETIQRFSRYRTNAQAKLSQHGSYLPGLFINVGHGSKGLATAPLSAEILAAYLLGEPMPVTSGILAAIHPARFTIKKLKRNEI